MKKYNFIALMVICVTLNSCKEAYFIEISQEIQKKEGLKKISKKYPTFNDVRVSLYKMHKLDFLQYADTVYLLESYYLENAAYYDKIWTSKDTLEYKCQLKNFTYGNTMAFSQYMTGLISKWDTIGIRQNEKLYSDMIPQRTLHATRISNYKNHPEISTINFYGFYKPERIKSN
jgi:hypothetical protein